MLIELVVNHTSDQHPWFQAARAAPRGSRERDFYVWSDTDQKFPETRIIFTDTEKSNWTWDPVAGQYYWHRFFSHQPDLNHDNPEVVAAVIDVMKFWLDLGVDGLRLDAVPYLCEREGTNNENLPETHAVLKQIRRELDAQYPRPHAARRGEPVAGRRAAVFRRRRRVPHGVPLPADAAHLHGACGRRTATRSSTSCGRRPSSRRRCQWALFLRNHDELTLEMVTDEERDYMYDAYAADPLMRAERRHPPAARAAHGEQPPPHRAAERAAASRCPGTPVIYYGDEIGMGDNIYLGDRNGVRTPMQWSGDRNAGFSRADPARLYAPPIMDPGLRLPGDQRRGAGALPVLAAELDEAADRAPQAAPGARAAAPSNSSTAPTGRCSPTSAATSTRRCSSSCNLSRQAQPVSLDLAAFEGLVPVEMIGETEFPRIGDGAYPLSLGPVRLLRCSASSRA